MMDIQKNIIRIVWLALACLITGCAHQFTLPSESIHSVYVAGETAADSTVSRYAPIVLTYGYRSPFNRIGQPTARQDETGKFMIFINTDKPVMYWMKQNFSTGKGAYTNLIYRVHFPEVPFSLLPFHLTMGKNVGLIVIVTLDSKGQPVLVTTVHTCGCYLAIIPTSYLPDHALPETWRPVPVKVYGEVLPWALDFSKLKTPRLLIRLRPGVHRVMALEVVGENSLTSAEGFSIIDTPLKHMEELDRIQVDGGITSLYYQDGLRKGLVKGSFKPFEAIMLSLISWDLFVGSDKSLNDGSLQGPAFYTSLKPWNRKASDMRHFVRFLEFWGWNL